jgi:hypothetical protein
MAGPLCPKCGCRILTFWDYVRFGSVLSSDPSAKHGCAGCGAALAPEGSSRVARWLRIPGFAVSIAAVLIVAGLLRYWADWVAAVCVGLGLAWFFPVYYLAYRGSRWRAADPASEAAPTTSTTYQCVACQAHLPWLVYRKGTYPYCPACGSGRLSPRTQ